MGKQISKSKALTFVDVFAGCGGLSLGLINAGWSGCFAVEKNKDAFNTLKVNLVTGKRRGFIWPDWLPHTPTSTLELLNNFGSHLKSLKGKIELLAGGPPCQGFSMAGRRTHSDPRNSLTEEYIEIVNALKPRFLLIENVKGFTMPFRKNGDESSRKIPYSARVQEKLEQLGYAVFSDLVDLSYYGVPQTRKRFILIAIRNDDPAIGKLAGNTPFDILKARRKQFLSSKGLPSERPICVEEAIGDLVVTGKDLIENTDSVLSGYKQIIYKDGSCVSPFIKLMRKGVRTAPDSLRLPNHKADTINQFREISATCERGKTLSDTDRKRLGIKKHALTPLSGCLPSATITTLPDDIIHYSEPRILTVRENARMQTFPDWYNFTGKYTTGGKERKNDCPRYTQVGNAVPPLFSEAIGRVLKELASDQQVP
ncbi:MAG: DNA cytosine methyltransferase [Saprospiraceae bacterium]|nr:DNA cytosine methyltransferase [Saprospiraceae bacterium]